MNICMNCKSEFVAPFGRKCYYCCDECRKEALKKQHAESRKRYNEKNNKSYKRDLVIRKRNKKSNKSLDEIVREIEAYNCIHGTRYTYGDWDRLNFFGKI